MNEITLAMSCEHTQSKDEKKDPGTLYRNYVEHCKSDCE